MKLTPNGTAVLAGGGQGVSLLGGPILLPSSGLGCALDDATVLAVQGIPWGQPGEVVTLKRIDLTTGAVTDFGPPGNFLAAGHGEWVVGRPGSLRWSLPFDPPVGAAVGDVDPFTGRIVLKAVAGEHHDLLIYDRAGNMDHVICEAGVEWVRIRHDRLIYVANNGAIGCFDVTGAGLVRVPPPAALMRSQFLPVKRGDHWHVAYPTFDALKQTIVCHQWGDCSLGVYTDAAPPQADNWDAHGSVDDVTIAWSVGAAELSGEGRLAVGSALVDLVAATARPVTIVVPTLAPLDHFAWVMCTGQPQPRFRLTWLGDPHPGESNVRGLLVSAEGGNTHAVARADFERQMWEAPAVCRRWSQPLVIHWDGYGFPRYFEDRYVAPAQAIDGVTVIPSISGYPVRHGGVLESADDTLARVEATIVDLLTRHRDVSVWGPAYSQWNAATGRFDFTPLPHLLKLLEGLWALCRRYRVRFINLFDWTRPGGVLTYPPIRATVEQMLVPPTGSEPWPLPRHPSPIDPPVDPPVDPAEEDDDMPATTQTQEQFDKAIEVATDLAIPFFPTGMGREHVRKSMEGAGHRPRSNGLAATVREMVFGGYMAARVERPLAAWPEPQIDGNSAKAQDKLYKDALEAGRLLR